jgi:hypothetical protein
LNSYWRFLERDNGVVVECESVSLSRSIPYGLGWLVRQYVALVPRESFESVLTSIRDGAAVIHCGEFLNSELLTYPQNL